MPGAGHLRLANWLYNAAPRDGTVIATTPQSIAIEQALGTDGIQYDAARYTYIGRAAPVVEVTYTWHTSKTKSIADARTRETVMGGSGQASPTVFYLKALNALAGTKFSVVAGFRGVSETELAVQRGEVEGGTKAWASMKVDNAQWLRDKQVQIILQYAIERAPDLPDVPMMAELGLDDARHRGAEAVRRRQRHGPLDLRDARHSARTHGGAAQGVHGHHGRPGADRVHQGAQYRSGPGADGEALAKLVARDARACRRRRRRRCARRGGIDRRKSLRCRALAPLAGRGQRRRFSEPPIG